MHLVKPLVRLENWAYLEYGFPRLQGDAYGHPNHPDGKEVWTSRILKADGVDSARPLLLGPGTKVETENTVYVLGERYAR